MSLSQDSMTKPDLRLVYEPFKGKSFSNCVHFFHPHNKYRQILVQSCCHLLAFKHIYFTTEQLKVWHTYLVATCEKKTIYFSMHLYKSVAHFSCPPSQRNMDCECHCIRLVRKTFGVENVKHFFSNIFSVSFVA